MAGSGDRTEKPTAKRLRDARTQGAGRPQPRPGADGGPGGVLLVFSWVGSGLMGGMADSCRLLPVGARPVSRLAT